MSNFDPNHIQKKVFARVGQKAVIYERGSILLMKRSIHLPRPGGWDLAGGGLDDGEDPIEGIKREIAEETGLQVKDVKPTHVCSLVSRDREFIVMIGYQAKADSRNVKLNWEHDTYKWIKKSEVARYDLPDDQRKFVDYLVEN